MPTTTNQPAPLAEDLHESGWHKFSIILLVTAPIAGVVAAIALLWNQYVFWEDLALMVAMYSVAVLGVTIGYHRMLTHKGFTAPEWLRGFFLICGCTAFEGPPLSWTATHIKHHAFSDDEGDPHSPIHGFWHAHMGWLFTQKNFADPKQYAPHLLQDRTVMFVSRTVLVWMALSLLIPFAIGGWTGLVWGGLVRIFLNTHITWAVNSVCHTFGKRDFETTDESRNQWVIGLLGFGEGWHNNHHAFPSSAFHGFHWWQFDMTGLVIRGLEQIGLVKNVVRIQEETLAQHREQTIRSVQMLHALRATVQESITVTEQELRTLPATPDAHPHVHEFLSRLSEIGASIRKSVHIKRPRLVKYLSEIEGMKKRVQELKQRSVPAMA